ncbi:NADH-quinone oxidoreductase subunit NuoN [Lysobacter soyae]
MMQTTLTQMNPAELWPLLPELVLAGAAFALLMLDIFLAPKRQGHAHWLGLIVLLVVAGLTLGGFGGHGVVLNEMFIRDNAADVMKTVICVVSALAFVYAWPYLRARGLYQGEISILMLLATLGMMLMVSANSLVMIYLGLEMLALSSYALVASDRDNAVASEGAMKYFVLGALASGMLLFGMSLIYGAAHSLNLAEIYAVAGNNSQPGLLLAGSALAIAGIAFKLGAAPFHMWLPDVYESAPTPITLFIGSAPKIAALAMLWRLLETGLGSMGNEWHSMIAVLAALSLVIGNLFAIMQTNLRRMLAYSTISHMGYVLTAVAGGGQDGYSAALIYTIFYALMTTASFGLIALLARDGFEADKIDDYRGLLQRSPFTAFMMLCVMASLAGIPPFVGFFIKLSVLQAAIQGGFLWLALVGVVMAVVGAFYYLRVIKVMMFDSAEGAPELKITPTPGYGLIIGINCLLLLVASVFYQPIMAWCVGAFA